MGASGWYDVLAVAAVVLFGSGGFVMVVRWAVARWLKALDDAKAAMAERIGKLEERVNEQGKEIAALKTRVVDTPSTRAFHELSVAITELRGEVQVTNERLSGMKELQEVMRTVVARQEGYLRESGR